MRPRCSRCAPASICCFIIARALFLSVNLVIPFYVLYARELTGGAAIGLSWFVIANGLAEVLSSPFWGRFSDRSSRKVMIAGGALALITGAVALLMGRLPQKWQTPLLFSSVFLLAGFARASVRLGRKTYLVDGAPDEQRPLFVAVSNTVVGGLTLVAGSLGVIAEVTSVPVLILTFLSLTALGMVVSWRMPEAEEMVLPPVTSGERRGSMTTDMVYYSQSHIGELWYK